MTDISNSTPGRAPAASSGRRSSARSGDASSYRSGARRVAPIALTVAVFGVSFGVLARSADMGAAASIVMSATTFAGSAQFAAASVHAAGGGVGAAVVAAVLLNARYAPISVTAAHAFDGSVWRRLVEAQLVVDESWIVARRADGRFDRRVLLGAGMLLYACWVTGTALGAVAGTALADPASLGLDAAFPALFLALLVSQLASRRALAAAVTGGAIAAALIPVAPPGVPIIAAAAACVVGWERA